jgi:hypothetical protein
VPKESYSVFVHSEGVYGIVRKIGAHISFVEYYKDGIYYEDAIENSDLTFIEEE